VRGCLQLGNRIPVRINRPPPTRQGDRCAGPGRTAPAERAASPRWCAWAAAGAAGHSPTRALSPPFVRARRRANPGPPHAALSCSSQSRPAHKPAEFVPRVPPTPPVLTLSGVRAIKRCPSKGGLPPVLAQCDAKGGRRRCMGCSSLMNARVLVVIERCLPHQASSNPGGGPPPRRGASAQCRGPGRRTCGAVESRERLLPSACLLAPMGPN
jgi:hypothetical protein